MSGQLGQIALVVWRESVEALLVIGILDAWLRNAGPDVRQQGRRMLWLGVAAGVLLAFGLAALLVRIGDSLEGDEEAWFRTAMVLAAAALILQMVFWMRSNGRSLRAALDARMHGSVRAANWFGVFALAAIAVAREGSETVTFVYGIVAAGGMTAATVPVAAAAAAGFAAAGLTYALLVVGSRVLSWRVFFRLTEVMLFLLAGSLVVAGASELIGLGILPPLSRPLWDTSWLLDDSGPVGGLVAGLTGYRARPEPMLVIVFALYWGLVIWMLRRSVARRSAHGPSPAAT